MKVKIGNDVYDSNDMPIVLEIDDSFKQVISDMPKENNVFLAYPTTENKTKLKEIRAWALEFKNEL